MVFFRGALYNDNQNKKVELNITTNEIFFQNEKIPKPTLNNLGTIKIYKNNTLIRIENISPEKIALQLHKIKNLRNANHIESLLNESVSIMESLEIEKHISYNSINNTSTIQIQLKNIPASLENLVIYEVIPKSVAPSSASIKNLAVAKFFVYDDDPTIGWNFKKPKSNENISYEVGGETEGGNIILFLEPVLFNEGNLIFNYRSSDCGTGELKLFGISSFDNSSIVESLQNSNYSVCVNYLNSSIGEISLSNLGDESLNLLSFFGDDVKLGERVNPFQTEIKLYAKNKTSTLIFFDLKIQKGNPDGNYSCLGSINEASKRFGDCSFFEERRIWIHLGGHLEKPASPAFRGTLRDLSIGGRVINP